MLEIYFITSNPTKLAHFTYLGRLLGVKVVGFRQRTYYGSYSEPDSNLRDEVLSQSYESAVDKWRRSGLPSNAMFFFEDTSVRIGALSSGAQDFPGTRVKFWMRETTFDYLNKLLGRRARDASIRSDLVLHVPDRVRKYISANSKYFTFSGEVQGKIAGHVPSDAGINLLYPWLDPNSFSGWFIPDGATGNLSNLSIVEADKFDFRFRSFSLLLSFLEKFHLHTSHAALARSQRQLSFGVTRKVVVFLGQTCAGKTTAARQFSDDARAIHLEASDFMRAELVRRHGSHTKISVREFAALALKEQPWIVPEQLCEIINKFPVTNFVVSGLRSLGELQILKEGMGDGAEIIYIWIKAPLRLRYSRSVKRKRSGAAPNFAAFREDDRAQLDMGLDELRKSKGQVVLQNKEGLATFGSLLEKTVALEPSGTWGERLSSLKEMLGDLEMRLLYALGKMGGELNYFTSGQMAKFTQDKRNNMLWTEKDNISRFFNQATYPFFEIKPLRGGTAVKLSNSGVSIFRQFLGLGLLLFPNAAHRFVRASDLDGHDQKDLF